MIIVVKDVISHHGSGPAQVRYENFRSIYSFISGTAIAAFWFVLLGPILFFVIYLPAFTLAALFVIHFNWSGHNAHRADQKIEPANLDYGWYWLGNRLFFGIYFHANHHKMARMFNPMKMPAVRSADGRSADGRSSIAR